MRVVDREEVGDSGGDPSRPSAATRQRNRDDDDDDGGGGGLAQILGKPAAQVDRGARTQTRLADRFRRAL